MSSIAIIGGTGYTGAKIANQAVARGHTVRSLSRSAPKDPVAGVGGFSSLRPAPDAPRFVEGDLPEEFAAEAREMDAVPQQLADSAPVGLDRLFVSPAGGYGGWDPGEATGRYRIGGEVALFDEAGGSKISGADFALAIVDEIDNPAHHREHISVAY